MDVTCPRCATEYEFDETLVSDRGTTVKCTNCGHLFKVYPPGAQPGESERAWMVRRQDGTEERLASLRDLQQRITRGELGVDDRISRSGEAWKRLGDIAELQTFFRAAEAANAPPDATEADPRKQTLFGVGAVPSVPAPPPPPRTPPPRATPPRSAPAARPAAPSNAQPPPPQPPPPQPAPPPRPPEPRPRETARPPRPAPPTANVDTAAATVAAETAAGATVAARPTAPRPTAPRPPSIADAADTSPSPRPRKPLYLDDADEQPPIQTAKRSSLGLWLALLLLLAAGGAAAYLLWPTLKGGEDDPIADFLQEGDDALAHDTVEAYEEALSAYLRASAYDERDPRVLAALARTHTVWAQLLEFRASDLEARADTDPALRGEASSLRRERDRRAREAKEHAETLLRLHPGDARAELAAAEAFRLAGDLRAAEAHLDRAREMFGTPTPALHLAEALLALERGRIAEAAEAAAAAVASDGSLLRARLLLARLEIGRGDIAAARAQIDAVLAQAPGHPEARRLAEAIDEGLPPASPIVAVVDGGTRDGGVDSAPEAPGEATPPEPSGDDHAATGRREPAHGGAPPRGRDYSWYIRRGDALLDAGDLAGARAHYELAEEQRPGSVEALTGLGQVALRQGNLAEAARRFRPAARADYGDAYIGLAEAYRRMGRTEDALATYRAYLASRPSGPHANLARRQVEALTTTAPTTTAPTTTAPTTTAPTTAVPTTAAPTTAAPTTTAPTAMEPEPSSAPGPSTPSDTDTNGGPSTMAAAGSDEPPPTRAPAPTESPQTAPATP